MHRTGRYRKLNLIFGLFPFVAAVLLALMREDSHPIVLWLSIVSVPPTDTARVDSLVFTNPCRSRLDSVTRWFCRLCSVRMLSSGFGLFHLTPMRQLHCSRTSRVCRCLTPHLIRMLS